MNLSVVAGPHGGWWVKDGDKVLMWSYSKEHAEQYKEELVKLCGPR